MAGPLSQLVTSLSLNPVMLKRNPTTIQQLESRSLHSAGIVLAIYRFPPKNPPEKPRKHNIWRHALRKGQISCEMPMHPTRFMSCGAHRTYGHFSGIATAYCMSQGPS